jgi:hypothetical protein
MGCRSESAPALYSGPSVTVMSSNITSSEFSTTLLLSNATQWWGGSGSLDITSTSAPLIWALGSSAPSDPSDPSSSIQQHRTQGTFSVNMKAAQYTPATGSTTSNGTSSSSSSTTGSGTESSGPYSPSLPSVTGGSAGSDNVSYGLSSRDKVPPTHEFVDRLDYYCTWRSYGIGVCDFIPLGSNHHSIPRQSPACTSPTALRSPNLLHHRRPRIHGPRCTSLHRHAIHLFPYSPLPSQN